MENRGQFTGKFANYRGSAVLAFILVNLFLLSGVIYLFIFNIKEYREKLNEENTENIENLNRSAAMNLTSSIKSWALKLDDIAKYITKNDLSYEESLEMIYDLNSYENHYFEIIGEDYKGHLVHKDENGKFIEVSFTDYSYEVLKKSFDDVDDDDFVDICFMPEFTDNGLSGDKMFGIYKHVKLKNELGEEKNYTIILAMKSREVLSLFNSQTEYVGQSTVLFDFEGNYIVSNNDYKSTNFYRYLYIYNNLTLDEKNSIQEEVLKNKTGLLYYKNAAVKVEDCVYAYECIDINSWYCVTVVPISSFHLYPSTIIYVAIASSLLLALLIVDITWLQITNKRLQESIVREVKANEAKSNFMSIMSHEIRTPLNAIIGYNAIASSEILQIKDMDDYQASQMKIIDSLGKSQIASKHLLTVINDVLDMATIESGKVSIVNEEFDLKKLITSLTTVFNLQLKAKSIDFKVELENLQEELIVGDQLRLNQVLTNLLSNATKFTLSGGLVRMRISQKIVSDEKVLINFEVKDTGIGMGKEFLTRIWTPFEQADSTISRRFGGSGLGLSITKQLVDLMNGKITVESEEGKGTTFSVLVTFNRCLQDLKKEKQDFSFVNALIIEDDKDLASYIEENLNSFNARSTLVSSLKDASDLVVKKTSSDSEINICLVDFEVIEKEGSKSLAKLRKTFSGEIPIVILAPTDFSELEEKLKKIHIDMFISKPLFKSSLVELMNNIFKQASKKDVKEESLIDFKNFKILLAEDNDMNMEIAKTILEEVNLVVDEACNGEEAVSKFKNAPKGTYKLILMDIHMPVLDGNQATRIIRDSDHPDAKTIPIIAMTADVFAKSISESMAAGMNEYISKPIDVGVLYEKIKKYIN